MKIKVEVEMTPEEMRRLFGWPDMTKVQNLMLEQMSERIKHADLDTVKSMMKPFVFEGFKPMENYQHFLTGLLKMAGKGVMEFTGGDEEAEGKDKPKAKSKSKAREKPSDDSDTP